MLINNTSVKKKIRVEMTSFGIDLFFISLQLLVVEILKKCLINVLRIDYHTLIYS